MRSGQCARSKSFPLFSFVSVSKIGIITSSQTPGLIVDSIITSEPFFRYFEIVFVAFLIGSRSGVWSLKTGVGTHTMNMSESFNISGSVEAVILTVFMSFSACLSSIGDFF